jgi:hypothetical protein
LVDEEGESIDKSFAVVCEMNKSKYIIFPINRVSYDYHIWAPLHKDDEDFDEESITLEIMREDFTKALKNYELQYAPIFEEIKPRIEASRAAREVEVYLGVEEEPSEYLTHGWTEVYCAKFGVSIPPLVSGQKYIEELKEPLKQVIMAVRSVDDFPCSLETPYSFAYPDPEHDDYGWDWKTFSVVPFLKRAADRNSSKHSNKKPKN